MRRYRVIVGFAALFLVVLIAASLQGTPVYTPPQFEPGPPPPPPPLPTAEAGQPSMPPLPEAPENPLAAGIAMLILSLLAATVGAFLLYLLIRWLVSRWNDRALARQNGSAVGIENDTSAQDEEVRITRIVQRGIAGAIARIDQHERPDDAIIAAWVGLEESATDAGLNRGISETPTEFAVRLITGRAAISGETQGLLDLYERVRFGGYEASSTDRDRARAALHSIEEAWR